MINLHINDTQNVGDFWSAPAHYFPVGEIGNLRSSQRDEYVVYGGGAIARSASEHARRFSVKGVAWGVGSTERRRLAPVRHPKYDGFVLAGVRDWPPPKGIDWVPCASCMNPLFDNPPEPSTEIVFYGHKALSPMGDMNNDCMDLEAVIRHLASGETVVTSSYHGVYWALLLGRRVVCKPFGSKFFGFRHKPTMINGEYEGEKGKSYNGLLEEYRELNEIFWGKVANLINI